MQYTLEEIKRAVDAAPQTVSPHSRIFSGELPGGVKYDVHLGWDLIAANLCDKTWGAFNVSLLRHIHMLEQQGVDIDPILESAQLEDHHWRWLDKTLHYRGESYKWFFLVAEGYPQAACLMFHPKASVAGAGDIFYIEYIAAAPWNRENVLAPRVFKGMGPRLLGQVIEYAKNDLKLRPGFSLHSLPKAVKFYEETLGMTAFPQYDKGVLKFFELVEATPQSGG